MSRPKATAETPLAECVAECRERLKRAVALRLDPRLLGRIDPSDVVQDAALEATERYEEYLDNPALPPQLWLRLITLQRLALVHRQNLGVKARDVRREIHVPGHLADDASQTNVPAMVEWLIGRLSTPSQAAVKNELRAQVQAALDQLDPLDREVLALRHFEQLTHEEAARVLGVSGAAASKRYVRALRKMRSLLTRLGPETD
jgi:RNA polymerase sigma-70 factor (ECF subfamily)